MIKKNTVFILGAGASYDFGFPLGRGLREAIIQSFNSSGREEVQNTAKALSLHAVESQDYIYPITEFANKLNHDADYSIDAFLERFQKSYLTIGKLAIAQILAKFENHDRLFESDNWYRAVYKKMKVGASIDTFNQNKVSFITFNYDRSLEHFLYTALLNFDENIKESQVLAILENMPIVHIYGQLDYLPWQRSEGRPYGRHITIGQLREYRKNINIIFENMSDTISKNFQKATNLLEEAERIYILGFGFHPINMDRLKLNEMRQKNITATSFNLEPEVIQLVRERLALNTAYPVFTIYSPHDAKRDQTKGTKLYNMSVYDFISKYAILD